MPKKGEKMPASQRAKIAAANKKRNDEKRASQPAAASVEERQPALETVGGIAVEVAASQPAAAPKSLLDSVLGSVKRTAPASSSSTRKDASGSGSVSEDNFIFALVPVASGFLAYYSSSLWGDGYKDCSPSKAEVSAILTPITNMIARRMNIQLKETPDLRDTRLAATALLLYVVRAATLAIEINERTEKQEAVAYAQHLTTKNTYEGRAQRSASAGDARTGTNQGAASGVIGSSTGPGDRYEQFRDEQSRSTSGVIETDAEYARRTIADAFKQDQLYRSQNGLL